MTQDEIDAIDTDALREGLKRKIREDSEEFLRLMAYMLGELPEQVGRDLNNDAGAKG